MAMKKDLHPHSLEAYYAGQLEAFTRREQEILTAYTQLGRATDRDICHLLGFKDLNCVRPRITKLVRDGVLQEVGTQVCVITGRKVRVLRIPPLEDPNQLQLFPEQQRTSAESACTTG